MTASENITVLRFIENRLAAFVPGSDEQPVWADEVDPTRLSAGPRSTVLFAAPGEEVRLQRLQISPEEKKHLQKSLPFMLEEQVADDVDSLHFVTAPLGDLEYAVALCSLDRMREWHALLAEHEGVSLWLAEPLLLPWREGEWCLVMEGDRVILRTGECDGVSAERELLPVLLTVAGADDKSPTSLVVYGEDQRAELEEIPGLLRDRVQWRKGNFCSALLLTELSPRLPNLRQGEFAARLPLARWWQQWRWAAAALVLAVGLQLIVTGVDYWRLQQENVALRTAVQESYRQAYPRGAVVDPEKQLRRQLDTLKGSGQSSGFVSLLEKVGAVVAARPGTSIATINYSDKSGELRMNILASDYEAVEKVRAGINASGLEAVMENSSAQGEQVRARIRVGEKS